MRSEFDEEMTVNSSLNLYVGEEIKKYLVVGLKAADIRPKMAKIFSGVQEI